MKQKLYVALVFLFGFVWTYLYLIVADSPFKEK
jgi:hypothetical protein